MGLDNKATTGRGCHSGTMAVSPRMPLPAPVPSAPTTPYTSLVFLNHISRCLQLSTDLPSGQIPFACGQLVLSIPCLVLRLIISASLPKPGKAALGSIPWDRRIQLSPGRETNRSDQGVGAQIEVTIIPRSKAIIVP